MLGFEKNCHQPFEASADTGRIEVRKRPTVGTTQSAPSTTSTMLSGPLAAMRRMRAATVSCGSGITIAGAAAAISAPPGDVATLLGRDHQAMEGRRSRR